MHWHFKLGDLTEDTKVQDQTFTPDELAILFVIYDTQPGLMTTGQKELLERLIVEGTVPSRRQYETARACRGILKDLKGTLH